MSGRENVGGQRADKGGGAEALARYKMYEYRSNSSLVLTSDAKRGDAHEPTGEPETLWGRVKGFGDRAHGRKNEELEDRKAKSKNRRDEKSKRTTDDLDELARKKKKGRSQAVEDVLTLGSEGMYRPKTKETRAAYESLLNTIQSQFGDQPADIIRGAAEEVLAVLKNDKQKDHDKKKDIAELMGSISEEHFAQLIATGKLISDYTDTGAGVDVEALDEDVGVAMKFENESDSESDGDVDEVKEDSDLEEDDGDESSMRNKMDLTTMDVDAGEEGEEGLILKI
jgi:pre-mRNA-splicing helicase BRR2